jgi:hypothetical protein
METRIIGGRSGYECFTKPDEDGNCIFLAAQWFPRAAVYSDYEGWHNKAFIGGGEFTLEFGDYDVAITVPADYAVSSTGDLVNATEILSPAQQERMAKARASYRDPVYIVTPQEAAAAEKAKAATTKTWRFKAQNVRDFAWAGSRKFIWDAMAVKQPGAVFATHRPGTVARGGELAGDGLEHVAHGDHALHHAVFIDDEHHLHVRGAKLIEQLHARQRLGHEHRRLQALGDLEHGTRHHLL